MITKFNNFSHELAINEHMIEPDDAPVINPTPTNSKPDKDYENQAEHYWKQVENTQYWKPITDELYDGIEEEGWVQDLTEDMSDEDYEANREIIKSSFTYKELDLYFPWQKDHIKMEYDYTINILNKFDQELKSKQKPPYHTLDFIDYDKGAVYIIKYRKSEALK